MKAFNDENKLINKQNPARSHCEQLCDLAKSCMVSRKKQKTKMAFGTRYRSHVYQHKVKTALINAKRDYGLNLYKKQHILESFILNLPVSIQESIKSSK